MNKNEFISELKKRINMPRREVENNFDITLELLKEILLKGEKVKLKNFGVFCFKQYRERLFFNPHTNAKTYLPPKKVIVFRCSKTLF